MKTVLLSLLTLLLVGLLLAAFAYWGLYSVAADEPHWSATSRLLEMARTQSVARRAADVGVPNLDDPQMVLEGAGRKQQTDKREAFVVIKHGLKMIEMPA